VSGYSLKFFLMNDEYNAGVGDTEEENNDEAGIGSVPDTEKYGGQTGGSGQPGTGSGGLD
jgi:hypothetical protein